MPALPSPLNIIGNLGGLSAWLAFSLLGHVAIIGWLAMRADTPVARGTTSLQVSLVQGRGNVISGGGRTAPVLQSTVVKPAATRAVPHTVSAALQAQPEVAVQVHSTPPPPPEVTSEPSEQHSSEPTNNADAKTSVITIVSASIGTVTGPAMGTTPDAPPGGAAGDGAAAVAGGGGDWEEARLTRQMRPEYPPDALAKGWEGQVLLRLRVNAEGNVQKVLVERSSGHEVLDRAAYRAARNWQFFPAREAGVPVAAEVKVPVVFARERD